MTLVSIPRSRATPITPYPGGPSYDGFVWWVENSMMVPSSATPPDGTLQLSYAMGLNLALDDLQWVPSQPETPSVYAMAVYNLGGAFLCEYAQDIPPSTYWTDLRNKFQLTRGSFGLLQSSGDQGTSQSYMIPSIYQSMTPGDLQLMKTPWGQAYLAIAGWWGAVWGLTP